MVIEFLETYKWIIVVSFEGLAWIFFIGFFWISYFLEKKVWGKISLVLSGVFDYSPVLYYGWDSIKKGQLGPFEWFIIAFLAFAFIYGKRIDAFLQKWVKSKKIKLNKKRQVS
jgi:hypothetical protein